MDPAAFAWLPPQRRECLRCGTTFTTRELGARCPACGWKETDD
jgi:Zn finger protein HypA/HybF involved in hydrogenase expression